jgi:hypothetical protein
MWSSHFATGYHRIFTRGLKDRGATELSAGKEASSCPLSSPYTRGHHGCATTMPRGNLHGATNFGLHWGARAVIFKDPRRKAQLPPWSPTLNDGRCVCEPPRERLLTGRPIARHPEGSGLFSERISLAFTGGGVEKSWSQRTSVESLAAEPVAFRDCRELNS